MKKLYFILSALVAAHADLPLPYGISENKGEYKFFGHEQEDKISKKFLSCIATFFAQPSENNENKRPVTGQLTLIDQQIENAKKKLLANDNYANFHSLALTFLTFKLKNIEHMQKKLQNLKERLENKTLNEGSANHEKILALFGLEEEPKTGSIFRLYNFFDLVNTNIQDVYQKYKDSESKEIAKKLLDLYTTYKVIFDTKINNQNNIFTEYYKNAIKILIDKIRSDEEYDNEKFERFKKMIQTQAFSPVRQDKSFDDFYSNTLAQHFDEINDIAQKNDKSI